MKKNPPVPARASPGWWRPVAWLSLLLNLVLIGWIGWSKTAPQPPPPPAASTTHPAPAIVRPRELAPYAAIGSYMAENNRIADLGWSQDQFAAFQDGFRASYEGRGLPMDETAKRLRDDLSRRVQSMLAADQPNPIDDYFRTLREKEGVSRTASGLHYRITEPGAGPAPKPADSVVISFSATLPDGRKVPSLAQARMKIVVHDLMPGLAEGVQLLHVGGKALVYVPPALAFPEDKWPAEIPKGLPLVFFLELHDVIGAP
jgi:FKBP-type peptidyl-prolyl cis-trans isomerase FkpA